MGDYCGSSCGEEGFRKDPEPYSCMASSNLNMSPYQTICTHFKPDSMILYDSNGETDTVGPGESEFVARSEFKKHITNEAAF